MPNDFDTSAYPLGSTHPYVLYNNAGNEDLAVNDVSSRTWIDRPPFNRVRKTLWGLEQDFNDSLANQQTVFDQFLSTLGFSRLGEYAAGLVISSHQQYVEKDGVPYILSKSVSVPYTITGDWATESVNFLALSDVTLGQDLANAADVTKGASLVARSTVVFDNVAELITATPSGSQIYATKSFHPGWSALSTTPRGGNSYVFLSTMPKARHSGGDIISVTSQWDGTLAGLPNFLNNVGDTDPTGSGCFVSLQTSESVHVDSFGAIPGNVGAAASNYAAIRASLKAAIFHTPIQLGGQREILFGNGTYSITGRSPLCFNRTEMEALPGGYRYIRGLKWRGTGMRSTTLQIISPNNGTGESWFYDTYDANYPTDSSVQDFVEFSGISFKGAEVDYTLPANQKTSGFRWVTFGWEKFMRFNDCSFDYMCNMFSLEGNGNADHNKWMGCSFTNVRDKAFYFNNNQSVANIFVGCDLEEVHTYGFVVGPKGGGDVTWVGGSVILYPELESPGVKRVPQNDGGLIVFDNSGVTSGQTSGANNGNYTFYKVRFETYEAKRYFVFSYRSDVNPYGSLRVNFNECTMVDPHEFEGGNAFPSVPYGGVYIENDVVVTFNDCILRKGYTFTVGKHTGEIHFNNVEYIPATPVTSTNLLAAECTVAGGTVGALINARGVKSSNLVIAGDYTKVMSADFTKSSGGRLPSFAAAQLKDPRSPWPQPNIAGPLWLYLPGGSLVRSVSIYKPAQAMTNPSANYGLGLTGADGTVLLAPVAGVESRAIMTQVTLASLYVVPPAPNNFIQVLPSGNASTETFGSKVGAVYVEYM